MSKEVGDAVSPVIKLSNPNIVKARSGILTALAIVAFVMVCTGIGKTGPLGFGPQRIDGAALASSGEHGTVIADEEGSRLLFINPSGRLVGMFGLADKETPISIATVIRQSGDDVYIAGITHADDGESIKTEGVVKFSMSGELMGTVWKKDYGADSIQVSPTISDIDVDSQGNLMLVQFSQQEMHSLPAAGRVTRVSGEERAAGEGKAAKEEPVEQVVREAVYLKDSFPYEICYDVEGDRCVLTDYFGELYAAPKGSSEAGRVSTGDRSLAIQAFDIRGDMAVLYDEKSHALMRADNVFGDLRLTELYNTATRCDSVRICGDSVTAVLNAGAVRIYDLATGMSRNLTEVPLTGAFAARSIAMSLSKAYLVVIGVIVIIQWIARSLRMERHDKLRRAIVATAMSIICMTGMALHMVDVFVTSLGAREASMLQIVSQASVASPAELGDAATNVARRAEGRLPAEGSVQDHAVIVTNVEGILASSFASGNGVQCNLYTLTEKGEVCYLFSSERDSIILGPARGSDMANAVSSVIREANELGGVGIEKAHRFIRESEVQTVIRRDKRGQDVVACVAPLVATDGTCTTVIEVSCHVESLLYSLLGNILGYLLAFVMIAASIYVISDEALRSGSAFLRYGELREQGMEWAESLLGRPLCFLLNLAFGLDSAFSVVIAKEILTNSGVEPNASAWGIPAFAITMGTMIGTLIHARLCSRIPGRKYALPMLMLGVVAQLTCFFAVKNNWFAIFIVCKLVSSASFGTTDFVSRNLAGKTSGKVLGSKRLSLIVGGSSVGLAAKGAAVVGSVIGGILAYFGNEWVYLAGGLASLMVVPLLLLALPKDAILSKHGDRANLHNIFVFLRSPLMLVTLTFAIFPTVLASGYRSYILPIFLDSAGISKTDIACLFALGNVFLYAFTDTLITQRDARGRWFFTWVALGGLGVLFILFSYNQAPTWAVVAVVVITVLSWLAGDWKYTARGWAKREYGFSFDQSKAALDIEQSVVKNAQAAVLAALASLGASTCCLILGIFFCISSLCYYLPTRKREGLA